MSKKTKLQPQRSYAVMIRLAGKDEELRYVPGTIWYAASYYPSFWGYWNYGWAATGSDFTTLTVTWNYRWF